MSQSEEYFYCFSQLLTSRCSSYLWTGPYNITLPCCSRAELHADEALFPIHFFPMTNFDHKNEKHFGFD